MRKNPAVIAVVVMLAAGTCVWSQQGSEPATKPAVANGQGKILLPVTVLDEKQHLVTDLKAENFTVYEDDRLQQISSVSQSSGAVSMGILVDNSGSMRPKREAVARAVAGLVRSGGPKDEYFVVEFSDDAFLQQDFTTDVNAVAKAFAGLDPRGGTALYDAVSAASQHLMEKGKNIRKVLLIITDGEDNESRIKLQQAVDTVRSDGAAVYAVGLLTDSGQERRARRALQTMAEQSGGSVFFQNSLNKLEEVCREAAEQMRGQYVIEYQPSSPLGAGGNRKLRVVASSSKHKKLIVQTAAGYMASAEAEHRK